MEGETESLYLSFLRHPPFQTSSEGFELME